MIELEPFAEKHLGEVQAMIDDPEVVRFTRLPDPVPPDFARTWLERYEAARAEGTREVFVVRLDGEVAGMVMAPTIDKASRTVELGYLVGPSFRGRGVATEALRRVTEWAFAELGALRLELFISVDNEASKRVAERCGYVLEGVLRSHHLKGDLREDCEIWSKLSTDP